MVGGLLGVQAENYSQASWAVATRADPISKSEFDALIDAGKILRTHVLRPTWHFVLPDDIRWLVDVTAPRIRRSYRQLQTSLGVEDRDLEKSAEAITDVLSGNAHLTRDDIRERLRRRGLNVDGQMFGLALGSAELAGLICSGPIDAGSQTYALLEERAPGARTLDRDEAVAELVLRYFTGHGPATERDLAYWASMTLTDIRAGLAQVGDQLESFEHDGRTYWFGQPLLDDIEPVPRAHLLQVLDEYHNGFQDSRHVLDVAGIVPFGRYASVGMVLVDGQMVGSMRRSIKTGEVVFELSLFRDLADDEIEALHLAADRYGSFLGLDARLVI